VREERKESGRAVRERAIEREESWTTIDGGGRIRQQLW
jgi:hypothetical protein